MLCTVPNHLTTSQPFYAPLKCCSPWQFVYIFVIKPILRHLGILISSSSAWLNGLPHDHSVWGHVIGVICCHQLCSASSWQACNPASLDKKSLMPALLSVPHMPHSAKMLFRSPTCLYGTTFAFVAPHLPLSMGFTLMAPYLPFGAHICLIGAPYAFMVPHLPFGAPFAFCKPHLPFGSPSFLKRPMTKYVQQPKGALVLDSQGAICG
jgi:hypothetical protein